MSNGNSEYLSGSFNLVKRKKQRNNSFIDYLYDDELGLYYCGDFCSKRVAGMQAAAMSGIDVADHVYKTLL